MARLNSPTKNKKTSIIVITGDDDVLPNLLSTIEKSDNLTESIDIKRHDIQTPSLDEGKPLYKRRKADLTCVICEDKCFGYNFQVISCGSCKSFFRRNASQNINDLTCLTNTNHCDITHRNHRQICRRCRLKKCLSAGMKWNSTAVEDKLNRQRAIEENKRSNKPPVMTHVLDHSCTTESHLGNQSCVDKTTKTSQLPKFNIEFPSSTDRLAIESTTISLNNQYLTFDDHTRINSVRLSHEKAFELTTITHDLSVFNCIIDQRSGLLYSLSGVYDTGMKLITFIRDIPEFELLHEQDRFILFKYNAPLVFFLCLCLKYDMSRDLVIDSTADSEEYAFACRQLALYCFGEKLNLQHYQLMRSMKKITDNDPIILQLMMIILVFVKTDSVVDATDNSESLLVNGKQVFEAQSIYTSLLFRYLMEKYSTYQEAVRQYSQLIQKTIQMQMLAVTYQKYLQEQLPGIRDDEVNPVLKSILHLH